jgi:hypothetical protein
MAADHQTGKFRQQSTGEIWPDVNRCKALLGPTSLPMFESSEH